MPFPDGTPEQLAPGQRACVIGAGSSGLTAVKALLEAGVPVDGYEAGSDIGGNWRYGNDNGRSSAYRSLHIISSKDQMAFSDFPMDDATPDYGHHSDVLRYFEAYADRFGLREPFRFNTAVERVEPADDGTWDVTLSTGETERYGAVVVCNGHHWSPRLPDFPGRFDGEELHAHHYTVPEPFSGKRVLVVGIGNSACDIAIDLCRIAERVVLSTRSSAYVVPKYVLGRPADHWTSLAGERLPLKVREGLYNLLLKLVVGDQGRYGLPKPDHSILGAHVTLNQEFVSYVGHGRIRIKPDVAQLAGDAVRFEDGTEEPFDAIVYATGYDIRFPFLAPDVLSAEGNRIALYQRVVVPERPGLYVVGLVQPLGAIMPLAEVQAEYVAGLLAGTMALPSGDAIRRSIRRDAERVAKRYAARPRHTIQVDFHVYRAAVRREMAAARKRARRLGIAPGPARPD